MFTLAFDFTQVIKDNENLAEEIKKEVNDSLEKAVLATYTHMVEFASQKLHSIKDKYAEALVPPNKIDDNTWEILVPKEILWIEDGIPADTDMIPWFLNSKMKKHQGEKGEYVIIPFKHNSGGVKSPLQNYLTDSVKKELKKKSIPFKKIEKTESGAAKKGLLHKMNINLPTNMHDLVKGTEGPKGHPTQSQPEGRSYLQGLRAYQKATEKAGETKKDINTFRIAGEWQRGKKWIHPGIQPLNSIEEGYNWLMDEWGKKYIPEIYQRLGLK